MSKISVIPTKAGTQRASVRERNRLLTVRSFKQDLFRAPTRATGFPLSRE
jgi:hypothetical protein